jgi:hypothetical protein
VPKAVRLTPTTAAGQAQLEDWVVHMEALGHRVIPWAQLPALHRRRLGGRVSLLRLRLRRGQPVRTSYGTQCAWAVTPTAPVTRRAGARARGAGRPRVRRLRTVRGDGGDHEEPEPPPGGFPLNFIDRAPVLWRARHARCLWRERREGLR